MKALLLSVEKQKTEFTDLPFGLGKLYEHLNCQTVQVIYYKVEETVFMFCADEEGLMVSDPVMSAIDKNLEPMLVGSFAVFGLDEIWEPRDLTEDECELLKKHILRVPTQKHPEGLLMLAGVEYDLDEEVTA